MLFVLTVCVIYVVVAIALWRRCRNAGHVTTDAWFAKTFLGPRGWSTAAIVLTTVAFGAVFEAVAEILIFINPERYAYTHVIPGLALA